MSHIVSHGLHNTLFKKVLLSMFPKEFTAHGISPAGMFVSFISAKQFFSLVNRKIIENYKLNLFDVALDPFEVKIGFGDKPAVKVKDVELYYSYCATANLNGHKMYNPSTMGNVVTMLASVYFAPYFSSKDSEEMMHALMTVYLLSFVFTARIKIFPYPKEETQKNFNRFVDCFFSFYQYFSTLAPKKKGKKTADIDAHKRKKPLMHEVHLFMFLFHFYYRCNQVFATEYLGESETYTRLFYDELQSKEHGEILNAFVQTAHSSSRQITISEAEGEVINLLMPADILIRYVFSPDDVLLTSEYICGEIFPPSVINQHLAKFVGADDSYFDTFMDHLLSYQHLKDTFFTGMQNFIARKFRNNQTLSAMAEIDEDDYSSFVGGNTSGSSDDEGGLPPHLKQESQVIEKLLNFYVTLLGGFCVSRGDSGYLRMMKPQIFHELINQNNLIGNKPMSLQYYGSVLYLYSKNVFYYKYAYDNIRAGKDKFNLPFRATLKEVYSNMFIISLFDQNFIATLLQDINPYDIKIHIKTQAVLDIFKELFSKRITKIVNVTDDEIIDQVYGPIDGLLRKKTGLLPTIQKNFTKKDITTLKSRFYSVDFWLMQDAYIAIHAYKKKLHASFGDMVIVGILSTCKDTLFGFFLFLRFGEKKSTESNSTEWKNIMMTLYIIDVLHVAQPNAEDFTTVMMLLYDRYIALFDEWIHIDDNPTFFALAYNNRLYFTQNSKSQEIFHDIVGEDIIRFRGFLKNITYYNKRYIMPA